MERFWRATGVALGRRWKVVVAVVVVVTSVLAIGAARLEFATGQDSYLNRDSQIAIDNVAFQDDFGGETIILLFSSEGDATVDELFVGGNLAELRRITDELAAVPEVFSAVTPVVSLEFSSNLVGGPAGTQALTGALARDEAGAEARGADIEVSLARRGAVGPESAWTLDEPAWVELLIFSNEGYELDGSGAPVAPPVAERTVRESLQGTFPNVDGGPRNATAVGGVILRGNASLDELSAGTERVVEILDGASFDGFELTVTGSPLYLREINDYLKGGMATLGLAALAVMAVVLLLLFKVRWRLLPLAAVVVGVAWAFSLLGLLGIDLSLVTISGLPILIGLGIDFAIQIHNRVEEEVVLDHDAHPISTTLANLVPPLIVATITGVVAFLSLRISKVPMIRDFGVLLAVGVVVLLVVGVVVPATALGAREWRSATTERGPSMVERLVVRLGGLPTRLGPALIALAAVLFVGGVLVEGRTKIQSDPVEWIDQSSPTVRDLDRLAAETDFASTLGVLVAANDVLAPEVNQLVYDFTIAAEQRPEVVATSSLVGTMEKVIDVPGATPLVPTREDVVNAAEAAPEPIKRALVRDDLTATQVNLRLAQASLEERAQLVEELEADLDERIAALDLPEGSVLLVDLARGQAPVKATPAGLATVGIGLLENLSANRAALTYLALSLAALFLVVRLRSLARALLALVPVLMAVGASSLVVGLLGVELSPLTTVSGPLVIASCAEFSVLILGRYLEERQDGRSPRDATDVAAARTGRAFFTSAATTIGGFAVLIGSALPLLRDFGIIVTLNVAIALLAALVALPPLAVWVDQRGWLGTQEQGTTDGSVRLAAPLGGAQLVGAVAGAALLAVAAVAVYATADTSSGTADAATYAPVPTTTTTTTVAPATTEAPPATDPAAGAGDGAPPASDAPAATAAGPEIDPSTFGTERPADAVQGIVFDLLVGGGGYAGQGVDPAAANCGIETTVADGGPTVLTLLAGGDPGAIEQVKASVARCGLAPEVVDGALAEYTGG